MIKVVKSARCPKCGSEWYDIQVIWETYEVNTDILVRESRAKCDECGQEYNIKEYFNFDYSENA